MSHQVFICLLITFMLTRSVCTRDWLYDLWFSNTSRAAKPTTLLLLSNKGGRGKFYVEHTQFKGHPGEWNVNLLYIPKWLCCGLKRAAKHSLADFTTNYLDNPFAYIVYRLNHYFHTQLPEGCITVSPGLIVSVMNVTVLECMSKLHIC